MLTHHQKRNTKSPHIVEHAIDTDCCLGSAQQLHLFTVIFVHISLKLQFAITQHFVNSTPKWTVTSTIFVTTFTALPTSVTTFTRKTTCCHTRLRHQRTNGSHLVQRCHPSQQPPPLPQSPLPPP
eukprot:Lankesteria_metandrocarpae@DN4833_c1_g2_i1.p2